MPGYSPLAVPSLSCPGLVLVPLTAAELLQSLPLLTTKALETGPRVLFGSEEKLVDCSGEGLRVC